MKAQSKPRLEWSCGECGQWSRNQESAEGCGTCRYCGVASRHEGYPDTCKDCQSKRNAESLQSRFDKAVEISDAGDWIYSEEVEGSNNGYFEDTDCFLAYCKDNEIVPPQWVFATTPTKLQMNADSIIESACETLFEDAYAGVSREAEDELQKLLDDWCERQGMSGFDSDYSKKIKVNYDPAEYQFGDKENDAATRTNDA